MIVIGSNFFPAAGAAGRRQDQAHAARAILARLRYARKTRQA
jgi:hypothetical protein